MTGYDVKLKKEDLVGLLTENDAMSQLLNRKKEWMSEEIRRRQRVIRIFPNEESELRLIGSILADVREEWMIGHKYFDM